MDNSDLDIDKPTQQAEIDLVLAEACADFMSDHAGDDPLKLALSAPKWPNLPVRLLAKQIEGRQKLSSKLPSWAANPRLYFPPNISQEQASSEATAHYKAKLWPWYQNIQSKVKTIYDLTLGMGIDAMAWAITKPTLGYERSVSLATITSHNAKALGADLIVHDYDFEADLAQISSIGAVNLIYLDPDRRSETKQRLFDLEECQPNAYEWVPYFLSRGQYVVVKCSPMLDLTTALRNLPTPAEILALSWKGDCRELILAFDPNHPRQEAPFYRAVELGADLDVRSFGVSGLALEPGLLASSIGQYIYDPGPALNKLHLADSCSVAMRLGKLHPKTYLYSSDDLVAGYPGRVFRLVQITNISSSEVQAVIKAQTEVKQEKVLKAHVVVRNLPMVSEVVAKQLGLKEGGDLQLFVCQVSKSLNQRDKVVLVCKRIA